MIEHTNHFTFFFRNLIRSCGVVVANEILGWTQKFLSAFIIYDVPEMAMKDTSILRNSLVCSS